MKPYKNAGTYPSGNHPKKSEKIAKDFQQKIGSSVFHLENHSPPPQKFPFLSTYFYFRFSVFISLQPYWVVG